MSRIGKMPVPIPSGVNVTISGQKVTVKGPKGQLEEVVPEPITVKQDGDAVVVNRPDESKKSKSLHGLSRSLINNMVVGVTDGYLKKLEVVGVGYRANAKGNTLELIVGLTHPINYEIPKGVDVKVERNEITVSGIDKKLVGEVAATIRRFKKPEVYKGKGIRYVGEFVRRKVGKAAAGAGG